MDRIFSTKLIDDGKESKKGLCVCFTLDLRRLDFFVVVRVIKVYMTRVNFSFCFVESKKIPSVFSKRTAVAIVSFFSTALLSTGVTHLQQNPMDFSVFVRPVGDDQEDEMNFQEEQYPMDVLSLTNVGDKFVKPVGDDQEDEMNFQEEVEDQPGADFFPDVENLDQVGKNEDYDEYEEKEDADDPNNKEYTNEKDTLDLDNQPSDETDKNKDSTENPIAPNSEGGNASSDAKEPATEQKYGPPDALKDAKQQWEDDQKTASHTFIETKQQVEETQKTA
ncbi:hypothetical protein AAC387_Pa02g5073 [Persea americana]